MQRILAPFSARGPAYLFYLLARLLNGPAALWPFPHVFLKASDVGDAFLPDTTNLFPSQQATPGIMTANSHENDGAQLQDASGSFFYSSLAQSQGTAFDFTFPPGPADLTAMADGQVCE